MRGAVAGLGRCARLAPGARRAGVDEVAALGAAGWRRRAAARGPAGTGQERRLKGAVAVRAGSRGECGRLGGGRRVGAECGMERVRQGLLRLGRGCGVVPGASGAAVVAAASRPRAGAPEGSARAGPGRAGRFDRDPEAWMRAGGVESRLRLDPSPHTPPTPACCPVPPGRGSAAENHSKACRPGGLAADKTRFSLSSGFIYVRAALCEVGLLLFVLFCFVFPEVNRRRICVSSYKYGSARRRSH